MEIKKIKIFDEDDYTVTAECFGHYVEFNVFASDHNYWTDQESLDPFMTGSIKWDGCSNWDFPNQKHFCGKKQARSFAGFFDKMYEWAAELMPEHEEYLIDEKYGPLV